MNGPADRPDLPQLIDWIEGRLPADEARAVAAAVDSGDARTTATVAWLMRFLTAAHEVPLERPPALVRQRLRQHFRRWSAGDPRPNRPPRHLPAKLVFDSRRDLAVAGVRAAGSTDDAVHLAFRTDAADLVVDVYRQGGRLVRLEGQLLFTEPGADPVVEATAIGPGVTIRTIDGDELGQFRLADVPEQVTELRVSNGELSIVAPLDLTPTDHQP